MFLPPSSADLLSRQGFIGRQVVLAQNSRDFVFIRRYRYMFALKSHRLGKTKNGKSDVERMTEFNPDEEIDETVKTRFQEIGPQMTLKMRWIRRGPLGETGDERDKREKLEAETGEQAAEFGEKPGKEDLSGDDEEEEEMDIDGVRPGEGDEEEEEEDVEAEELAKREIGLDQSDAAGQPNFPPLDPNPNPNSTPQASTSTTASTSTAAAETETPNLKKRKRRTKPSHPLYRPSPSPSASPEPEPVPLPTVKGQSGKKKNPELQSALSTVGKTWHAGRGEGGVREAAKRREWNWDVSLLSFFSRSVAQRRARMLIGSFWENAGENASLEEEILPLKKNLLLLFPYCPSLPLVLYCSFFHFYLRILLVAFYTSRSSRPLVVLFAVCETLRKGEI